MAQGHHVFANRIGPSLKHSGDGRLEHGKWFGKRTSSHLLKPHSKPEVPRRGNFAILVRVNQPNMRIYADFRLSGKTNPADLLRP